MKISKKAKYIFGTVGIIVVGSTTTLTVLLLKGKDDGFTKISTVKLTNLSFKIGGTENLGTINLKTNITLPKQLELRYFVGANVPTDDKKYTKNKPNTLKNGDVVHIKLFIKEKNQLTHKLEKESTQIISITIGNLQKIIIDSSMLKKDSFSITGFQSKGTIKLKDDVTMLDQVEIKYFKGSAAPQDDRLYQKVAPNDLSNGNKIFVKFFVKNVFVKTHKFESNLINPIEFTVSDLPIEIDTSKLNAKSFEFFANNGGSDMQWKDNVDLPTQVEIKYHTRRRFNPDYTPDDSVYTTTNPHNLQTNDIIYTKFFIKDEFKSTYQFSNGFVDTIVFKNILPPYIRNSHEGTIFEDSRGNIWAMGRRSKLYVLKKTDGAYAESWTSSITSGLTNGSNIRNGYTGTIFEDKKGNLWSMGTSKLQILEWDVTENRYVDSWTDSTTSGLTNGSNINHGFHGTIFQDKDNNLWAIGDGSGLQVLEWDTIKNRYVDSWTSSITSGLTNGSKIKTGRGSIIFQDKSGNLWVMGDGSKLQVLAYANGAYAESWTSSTTSGLTKGSKIKDGYTGILLQDELNNLWAMSNDAPLQVLEWDATENQYVDSWTNSTRNKLLKGSRIRDGFFGRILKDSLKNLWAMGTGRLQVLEWDATENQYVDSWTNSTRSGLTKGSNIKVSYYGSIFEDSQGNLWSAGFNTKPQVLARRDENSYVDSWTSSNTSKLLKGSNMNTGIGWTFFEDSGGNIWTIGYQKTPQVFDQKTRVWTEPSSPTSS